MNIQLIEKPFKYIVVDDFYDEDELKLVKEEVLAFQLYGAVAESVGGQNEGKTGSGIFLDEVFARNRPKSKVLTANRKLFCDELYEKAVKFDAYFGQLRNCTMDTTLINYYKDGEEYKPHRDLVTLSSITFLSIGEFTGGDFFFTEYAEIVKFKENRLILFPSCVIHQALPIKSKNDGCRVSIAQFLQFTHK
jgi:predicted 2-oxoglutarate/Fe(II)-dependent dioxygenase YbiX